LGIALPKMGLGLPLRAERAVHARCGMVQAWGVCVCAQLPETLDPIGKQKDEEHTHTHVECRYMYICLSMHNFRHNNKIELNSDWSFFFILGLAR
jgi:hypothetical protein